MDQDLEIRVPWWGWPLMVITAVFMVIIMVAGMWLAWAVLT